MMALRRPVAALLALACLAGAGCGRAMIARDDAVARENRGDQLYEKGDWEGAQKEYTRALDMGSRKLKLYNNLGNVHFRRGQYELAEKHYRTALGIDPTYLFSRNNLALVRLRLQDADGAEALLREAMADSPGSALLHNSLGQVRLRRGDLAGAVAEFRKAVELNPDYAAALNNLGDVFLKNPALGEDPLPFIMRAIQKEPDNGLFYDTLGWYYVQAGVFDEALIALGKALVHDPDNLEVRVHYATALEWLGKEKEAMEQWQAITELPGEAELIELAWRSYWELKGR
jgi:tetratricopeptide (TPR) repeat protein